MYGIGSSAAAPLPKRYGASQGPGQLPPPPEGMVRSCRVQKVRKNIGSRPEGSKTIEKHRSWPFGAQMKNHPFLCLEARKPAPAPQAP